MSKVKMKRVTIRLPEVYVKVMDELVKKGLFNSRAEIIRKAVNYLISKEFSKYRRYRVRIGGTYE